jgi:osmotically-inducible protein OsmY
MTNASWVVRILMSLFLTLSLPLTLSGCAGTATQESTGEYIDDATITTKIKAAFVNDPTVSALRINVDTFKGAVQLSGFANSTAEADRAVEIARGVRGVTSVKNNIVVK